MVDMDKFAKTNHRWPQLPNAPYGLRPTRLAVCIRIALQYGR